MQPGEYLHVYHILKNGHRQLIKSACMCIYVSRYVHVYICVHMGTSLMLVWLEAFRYVLLPLLQQVSDHSSKNEKPRMPLKMTNCSCTTTWIHNKFVIVKVVNNSPSLVPACTQPRLAPAAGLKKSA